MNESYSHNASPDAVILGGGCAGLWPRDHLVRAGYDAYLIEPHALGAGQTIWSQGILHSGLKYTLAGTLNKAARAIQDMPARWMRSIEREEQPDLSATTLRADHCHLWRTQSLSSRAGMIGARIGLQTKPETLDAGDRPAVLAGTPGTVARVTEPVIDPAAFLAAFRALHADRLIHDTAELSGTPDAPVVTIDGVAVTPRSLVITAGNGANGIRSTLGLPTEAMQVRPLRMVTLQGPRLPALNGHCVDGNITRVTITTQSPGQHTSGEHNTWQLGGDIAERGPSLSTGELLARARSELIACIPGIDESGALDGARWSTYDAIRLGREPDPSVPATIRERAWSSPMSSRSSRRGGAWTRSSMSVSIVNDGRPA